MFIVLAFVLARSLAVEKIEGATVRFRCGKAFVDSLPRASLRPVG